MTPAIEAVLLVTGAVLVVFGAAAITWPAGVLAVGVLFLLTVVDLRR